MPLYQDQYAAELLKLTAADISLVRMFQKHIAVILRSKWKHEQSVDDRLINVKAGGTHKLPLHYNRVKEPE